MEKEENFYQKIDLYIDEFEKEKEKYDKGSKIVTVILSLSVSFLSLFINKLILTDLIGKIIQFILYIITIFCMFCTVIGLIARYLINDNDKKTKFIEENQFANIKKNDIQISKEIGDINID